ncbi:MAG: hypothetical protein E6J02_03910 [Chloroflexi bacterium]|nr:MAG: hypothetical protein E6J02_03910 [Chloroflexota bacterium]
MDQRAGSAAKARLDGSRPWLRCWHSYIKAAGEQGVQSRRRRHLRRSDRACPSARSRGDFHPGRHGFLGCRAGDIRRRCFALRVDSCAVGGAIYLDWLSQAGLDPSWHRFVPEGTGGHTLVLAQAGDPSVDRS